MKSIEIIKIELIKIELINQIYHSKYLLNGIFIVSIDHS